MSAPGATTGLSTVRTSDPILLGYPGGSFFGRAWAAVKRAFGPDRVYKPNVGDRAIQTRMDMVVPQTVNTALYQAWLGFMQPIAEIYDLMPASNPVLHGIRRQLKAGVKRVAMQTLPAVPETDKDGPLAKEIADAAKARFENPDAQLPALIDAIVELRLRGGGLIEILWIRDPQTKRWEWNGFELVPQQRIRFDRFTGEIAIAASAFDSTGMPLSAFPRGTFICVTPDSDVPDFSKRGIYRSIISDWLAMQNVGGWWQEDIQFLGSPAIVASYATEDDRENLNQAFQSMGANAKIAVSKGTEVHLLEKSSRQGQHGCAHHEFETTRVGRMAIAFLGATQTVSVDPGAGSQQTANVMDDVRTEVLLSHWETILSVLRRDLLQVWTTLNWGLERTRLTPLLMVDLDEPLDASTLLDAFTKARDIGLEVGEDFVRQQLKWPKPAKGEPVIGASTAPAAPVDATQQDVAAKSAGPRRAA